MTRQYLFFIVLCLFAVGAPANAYVEPAVAAASSPSGQNDSQALPPIGHIQGAGDVSPYMDQIVSFRGVVTGIQQYRNVRGITYYTIFVQDPPGMEDGDPATPDGIAVFHGRARPPVAIGDMVLVTGQVIDFFGLTEIANDGLELVIESRNNPLPDPVPLNPPADNEAARAYYRSLEGMLVEVPGAAVVIGPTYTSCGLAVAREDSGLERLMRHRTSDPVGQAIHVLHHTNVDCAGFPIVSVGDRIEGLAGPLTYQFDLYRIVNQDTDRLVVQRQPLPPPPTPPTAGPGQISVASYNLENYFDTIHDTGLDSEPVPTEAELAVQRAKLAYGLGQVLGCPTLVGVQEVEKEILLIELAEEAAPYCGFTYQATHLESPDLRGIDVGLLSDPRRVEVVNAVLHQVCTPLPTGIRDRTIQCPAGQHPLSSRPPMQIDVLVDGRPLTLFVNHFKSKLGGEAETEPMRVAQAEVIIDQVWAMLNEDPDAAIVVMGDFNDYYDSPPLRAMAGPDAPLVNVMGWLPEERRYTFIYAGASQLIDGLLVSPALVNRVATVDILHVNADYPFTLKRDLSPDAMPFRSADHDLPIMIVDWNGAAAELPPAESGSSLSPWNEREILWVVILAGGLLAAGGLVFLWQRRRRDKAPLG